jgi:hypothetical protein
MLAYDGNGLMLGSGAYGVLSVLDKMSGKEYSAIERHEHESQGAFISGYPLFWVLPMNPTNFLVG